MSSSQDSAVFLTALSDIGSRVENLGDRVFEKLDNIRDETCKLSERMATVESWGHHQQESLQRWWDKTWPDHLSTLNEALKAHGERLSSLEKDRVTQERLDSLTTRCGENQELIAQHENTIIEMGKFQAKLKVYVAIAGAVSGVVVSSIGGILVHYFQTLVR